jgi:hypothetical protein
MKSLRIQTMRTYNISWQLVFELTPSLMGIVLVSIPICHHISPWAWTKETWLSCHSYLAPKEGDAPYEQQCDVILKHEHLWFQALLVISNDTTLICEIHEDLKKDLLAIGIQGQLRNHHQI